MNAKPHTNDASAEGYIVQTQHKKKEGKMQNDSQDIQTEFVFVNDLREKEFYDHLKFAAYHEAAHAVVAVALGHIEAEAVIRPNPTVSFDELRVIAHATIHFHDCFPPGKLNDAIISIAGNVAEFFLVMGFDVNTDVLVQVYTDPEIIASHLSDPDRECYETLHPSWRPRALRKSMHILRKHWNLVKKVAQLFLRKGGGRVTVTQSCFEEPEKLVHLQNLRPLDRTEIIQKGDFFRLPERPFRPLHDSVVEDGDVEKVRNSYEFFRPVDEAWRAVALLA